MTNEQININQKYNAYIIITWPS